MSEEQRPHDPPPHGQVADAPDLPSHTQALEVEPTRPIPPLPTTAFPPPSGSPFTYQPPPGQSPAESWPSHGDPGPAAHAAGPFAQPRRPGEGSTRPGDRGGVTGAGAGLVLAVIAGAAVVALVAALVGGVAGALLTGRRNSVNGGALPVPGVGATARPPGSIANIAATALPSVVTIKVQGGGDTSGTGSGFVVRKDGFILTNNHVVASAADTGEITVEFSNGTMLPARVQGRDASYDLAVIRVERNDLPVLPLGSSASVVVGDPVIAVGAPLGLESTVTSGIVSALNRPVTPGGANDASYINAIQTDAAINPGNSGGPLLDMQGRVIGVNSAIARVPGLGPGNSQSGNIGVGFAIPSDQARRTADQLISTGKASHPVIGVILDDSYEGDGVQVASSARGGNAPVTKGGPADKAGIKAGDVILALNGKPISEAGEFIVAIRARSVGDTVELTIRRGSGQQTVKMTLQAASD